MTPYLKRDSIDGNKGAIRFPQPLHRKSWRREGRFRNAGSRTLRHLGSQSTNLQCGTVGTAEEKARVDWAPESTLRSAV
jgi:hypothetical protein